MNKNIKKIIASICTMSIAAGLIAGCGGDKTVDSDVTTITVWSGASHSKTVVTEYIQNWNETTGKEKGIKIDYIVKEGDTTQAIDLAIKTNQAPVLFNYSNPKALAAENKILALEDIPGCEELLEKYKPHIKESTCALIDGKTYSLPRDATTQGLIYNKDMFKAAGIVDENGEAKPPKTFDEVREYAKKLTDASKKQFGIILPMAWAGWYDSDVKSMMMGTVGHEGFNPVTGIYDNTGLVPIMDMILGIKEDESLFPGAETLDNDPARARFAEGNIGMKFAFSFDVGVFNDQFPAKCDWGVAPLPVKDVNDCYKQRMSVGGDLYVNADTAEEIGLDKIAEVLKFFYSDEYVQHMYKTGMNLPYDFEVVKDIKLGDDAKKGWKEFAELVDISSTYPYGLPYDATGIDTLPIIFQKDIWSGKVKDIEGVIKDRDVKVNAAVVQYMKDNPDYDKNNRILPDWDIKR